MSNYVPLLRRRREGLTDYRARKRAITSRSVLLVVRVSGKNVVAQFMKPKAVGDSVLSSTHSRKLLKLGWKGSLNATPACYLMGLLAGKEALAKGIDSAVIYNGLAPYVNGSRVSAFVKGVNDSGLKVPADAESYPDEDRISGKSIAEFAAELLKSDKEEYSRRFGAMLKRGFKPEDYPVNFEQAKKAVLGESKK
jgi:large subunit ribosomal protein L18